MDNDAVMEQITTQDWIDKFPGVAKLLIEIECHRENGSPEHFQRLCAISLRNYIDDYSTHILEEITRVLCGQLRKL